MMPTSRIWTKKKTKMTTVKTMHKHNHSPLFESLGFKDLEGLMKPTIHVDEFSSKMGDDDDIPSILYHNKINLYFSDNSKGDAFKFYRLMESDGYFLTVDDDLIYPPNYVEYMIAKCKEYGNTRETSHLFLLQVIIDRQQKDILV
jgi:hypothetical protein